MTFRSLALNNIRGNWRSYAAFFLSSVFSVLIFYLYASFVLHPDVVNGKIEQAQGVKKMMEVCMYLILIFSFFFVLYSSSAFVKTRKKEFGLLTLFGTTRGQLRKMVVYESLAVAALSIAAGLGLGILLSKLFILTLGVLIGTDVPIRFLVPGRAVLLTAGGFLLLFFVISLLSALRVGRSEIIDLLGEGRRPKRPPAFSPGLSALAALSLGAGYAMAAMTTVQTFMMLALPIIGFTVLGTYFLYTQLSVAVIRLLQRRKSFYYKGTNLLSISQLAFRIKDNARILFVVTVLGAIVMSAASTVYVFQKLQRDQILEHTPYTVGYVEQGPGHSVMDPDQAAALLEQDGGSVTERSEVKGLHASGLVGAAFRDDRPGDAMVVALSDYNREAERVGLPKRSLDGDAGFLVEPFRSMQEKGKPEGELLGRIGDEPLRLKLDESAYGAALSPIAQASWLLVVSDRQMERWTAAAPASAKLAFYGFELADWEHRLADVKRFDEALTPAAKEQAQTYRVSSYIEMRQSIGLTVFIGLFISVLFFIASGSLLYFKLFTELQEDRSQFRALNRIGLTSGELRRTVGVQVGLLYLVPCLVGIVHSLFAMQALGTLIGRPVWMYGLVVMGVYILMQAAYCLISWTTYTRSIVRDSRV
ncbi:ABC transporter permease protein YvcS [Paenibacillus pasadenensis]|uniref:ABC transporter permease protein YvcS n=1 Tax=Paenibacillus pasadenensis TaxID=217090 RepID=A0A2N5NA61_9BACL|nr:ABC transporter permease [Paenibacillus pasadenensis]PLT47251.1 ABC transporter permease protein YvcS [Paenibacillus pasadenensis]